MAPGKRCPTGVPGIREDSMKKDCDKVKSHSGLKEPKSLDGVERKVKRQGKLRPGKNSPCSCTPLNPTSLTLYAVGPFS